MTSTAPLPLHSVRDIDPKVSINRSKVYRTLEVAPMTRCLDTRTRLAVQKWKQASIGGTLMFQPLII